MSKKQIRANRRWWNDRSDRHRYGRWLAEHSEIGRATLIGLGDWMRRWFFIKAIPPRKDNERHRPRWAQIEAQRNARDENGGVDPRHAPRR